jgi:hypothetical protein
VVKAVEPRNRHVPLTGPSIELYIEAAANPDVADGFSFQPTPLGDKSTAGDKPLYRLRQVDIAQLDSTVWELDRDVWTLAGLMRELPTELPRRAEILRALERMLDVLDPDDVPGTAAEARACLRDVLASPAHASAHRVVAVLPGLDVIVTDLVAFMPAGIVLLRLRQRYRQGLTPRPADYGMLLGAILLGFGLLTLMRIFLIHVTIR